MKRSGWAVATMLPVLALTGCPEEKKKTPKSAPAITWSIADVSVDEADGSAEMTVSLSAAAPAGMSVTYDTSDETAEAPGDYAAAAGETLTIPEGKSSAKITLPLADDDSVEDDEAFRVTLSAPTKGTLATTSALVTIVDDDHDVPSGAGGGGGAGEGGAGASSAGTDAGGSGGSGGSGGTNSNGGAAGEGGEGAAGGTSGSAGTGGVVLIPSTRAYVNQVGGQTIQIAPLPYMTSIKSMSFTPQGGDPLDTIAVIATVLSSDHLKMAVLAMRRHAPDPEFPDDYLENPVVFIGDVPRTMPVGYLSSDTLKEVDIPQPYPYAAFGDGVMPEYASPEAFGVWSPDGEHFAFLAQSYDDVLSQFMPGQDLLFVVDADGNNLEQLVEQGNAWVSHASKNVHWSADSEALGFMTERVEPGPDYFRDAHAWTKAGGSHTYLYDVTNSAEGMLPRPGDGKDFVFAHAGKIYVASGDSASPDQISEDTEYASNPRWSPDGLHIGYEAIADGDSARNIWVVDDTGATRYQVTFGGTSDEKPFAFSPNGSLIAYASDEEFAGHPRLYQMDGDAPSIAQRVQLSPDADVTGGVTKDWAPIWSPDGAYVAYGWIGSRQGVQIAQAGQAQSGVPASPDDHDVIAQSAPKDPWTQTSRTLLPCWSSNSYHQLAYATVSSNGMFENVYRVNADGTNQIPAYEEGDGIPTDPLAVATFGFTQYDNLFAYVTYASLERFYRLQADSTTPLDTNSLLSGGPFFAAYH